MSTEAWKAIEFVCEFCNQIQYADYSLEASLVDDVVVDNDRIDCKHCGKENHVVFDG